MSTHKCPTCGSSVRVVGKGTLSYEPVSEQKTIEEMAIAAIDKAGLSDTENDDGDSEEQIAYAFFIKGATAQAAIDADRVRGLVEALESIVSDELNNSWEDKAMRNFHTAKAALAKFREGR